MGEVRYCTTDDGVRIAYSDSGIGAPLLCTPYFIESFALDHLFPGYSAWMEALNRGRRMIRFDSRGTGLSQREVEDVSPRTRGLDLEAVVRAAGLDQFAIYASAVGVTMAIAFAARSPERVTKLILNNSVLGGRASATPEATIRAYAELSRINWPQAAQLYADGQGAREVASEGALQEAELYRQSTSGDYVARLLLGGLDFDVRPQFPAIRAETLVVHGLDLDTTRSAQEIAATIPNARFAGIVGFPASVMSGPGIEMLNIIVRFLDGHDAQPSSAREPSGSLRTVLFTDIVGHTEMMSRLGDERGRAVLREHEAITREVLKANGGTEIKTLGDGFMASFGSVSRAVECAVALQRAFAGRAGESLSIRVGLNAGEPIEEDGDLFGASVILASRIAARAEGGEILVADTVRGLSSGKGFLFADRGEFVAKGIEEPVRIYEVKWQD